MNKTVSFFTHLELFDDEVHHFVIVFNLIHFVTHVGEGFVEDGEKHIDQDVRH